MLLSSFHVANTHFVGLCVTNVLLVPFGFSGFISFISPFSGFFSLLILICAVQVLPDLLSLHNAGKDTKGSQQQID